MSFSCVVITISIFVLLVVQGIGAQLHGTMDKGLKKSWENIIGNIFGESKQMCRKGDEKADKTRVCSREKRSL